MNAQYFIERAEIYRDGRLKVSLIEPERPDKLQAVNDAIKRYAEAWRQGAWKVQHASGQSVVFFYHYRVEFTRINAPVKSY